MQSGSEAGAHTLPDGKIQEHQGCDLSLHIACVQVENAILVQQVVNYIAKIHNVPSIMNPILLWTHLFLLVQSSQNRA